jgi:hypothetical protein
VRNNGHLDHMVPAAAVWLLEEYDNLSGMTTNPRKIEASSGGCHYLSQHGVAEWSHQGAVKGLPFSVSPPLWGAVG